MRLSTSLSAVTACCFLAAAPFASATVINTVQLSAASGGGQITVTPNSIAFTPGAFGNCPQQSSQYGDATSFCDASVSGGNMTYNGGIAVTTTYNAIIGDATLSPPSVQQPFIMIDTSAGTDVIEFTFANFITPVTDNGANCGSAASASPETVGKTCVAYIGSPFTLQATSGTGSNGEGTVVSLGITGTVKDVTTGQVSAFTGSLSQTLVNNSPYDIQQTFTTGPTASRTITTGFTGSFTATVVPEPGSLFMAFGGILVLAGAARRRKK